MKIGEKKRPSKVLVLVDWENLIFNITEIPSPEEISIRDALEKLITQIAREVGEIINVFVFAPPHVANVFGRIFYGTRFFIIFCPITKDKEGKDVNTTDQELIRFGETQIDQIPDLTHLCLGSGDRDFKPLVQKARRKGLKIIIIASSERSLAQELRKLADKIYILSLTE